jgi:hypothetical protein
MIAIAEPKSTSINIFGIKIPENALAQDYQVTLEVDGELDIHSIGVTVSSQMSFNAHFENLQECYLIGEPIRLKLICQNGGNTPLVLSINAKSDPLCQKLEICDPFEIQANEDYETTMIVEPKFDLKLDKQFILLEIKDVETGLKIFQHSLCLTLASNRRSAKEDLYLHIPCYARSFALGDRA